LKFLFSFHIASPGLLLGLLVDWAGTLAASHLPRLHKEAVVHDGFLVEAGEMRCGKSPSPINQQAQEKPRRSNVK
jgi:hypothetical protein